MIQDISVDKWGWLYALLFVVILIVVVLWLTQTIGKQKSIPFVPKQTENAMCFCPNISAYYYNGIGYGNGNGQSYPNNCMNTIFTNGQCKIQSISQGTNVSLIYTDNNGNTTEQSGQWSQGIVLSPPTSMESCGFPSIRLDERCGNNCYPPNSQLLC